MILTDKKSSEFFLSAANMKQIGPVTSWLIVVKKYDETYT